VLLLTDGQDFQRFQGQSAADACARNGLSLELAYADNNPFVQIRQVLEFIERPLNTRPAVIAIETASAPVGFNQAARAALAAGVGWIELSSGASIVETLRFDYPGQIVASVAADEEAIGMLQAQQCAVLLPTGGAILYVEGPTTNAVVSARRVALEKGLRKLSISITKTLAADWTEEGAKMAAIAWLQQASASRVRPDLICSQNDAMAMGVRSAASSLRVAWANIPMLGCDGVPSVGQRYVNEGLLSATVIKPATAGPAVEWMARKLRGENPPLHVVLQPESYPKVEAIGRHRQ